MFAHISQNAFAGHLWRDSAAGDFHRLADCLDGWLLPAAETKRPTVTIIVTYVMSIGSFTHIVAGSVDAFYLVSRARRISWTLSLGFSPLSNVLGGVSLVAALNCGQVAPEIVE